MEQFFESQDEDKDTSRAERKHEHGDVLDEPKHTGKVERDDEDDEEVEEQK